MAEEGLQLLNYRQTNLEGHPVSLLYQFGISNFMEQHLLLFQGIRKDNRDKDKMS